MSSINFRVSRERCPDCDGEIFCHHKVIICQGCNTLYHSNCSEKSFHFDHIKNCWICKECQVTSGERYNPFDSANYDKYDQMPADYNEDINTMSNILKSCRYYDKKEFNYLLNDLKSENKPFLSAVFNNIDGNASNFDHFIADLSQYKERFEIIAIAETNVDIENKGLFQVS